MKTGFKWFFSLLLLFICSRQWEGILLKLWGMIFSTGYNAHLSKSKRMLLGLLQNLEMRHPRQKKLNRTGSYGECRTIITALPRLALFQVCQISSNKLLLGVVLSSLLLRLFFSAIGTTITGGKNADILRHFWSHFLLYGQCMRLLLCHLFVHLEHGLGSMTVKWS